MSSLAAVGVVLIFVAIILIFMGSSGGKTKFAVGGFIGPVPFGFGNDQQVVKWVIIVSVVVAIVFAVGILGKII